VRDATIHAVQEELRRARESHPDGADIPALVKAVGDLVTVLMREGRQLARSTQHFASHEARRQAIQVIVVVVRLIEGV
jgi:hypothetical protein